MKFIIAGRLIEINALGPPIDRAFISLHASYFGHEAFALAELEVAAQQFFDANPADTDQHNAYFNNFTVIWQSFLVGGSYEEAERIWNLALSPALQWEAANPEKFIHKGTAYYFWGMTALLRGDLDKGYALMHRGVEEDIRTMGRPTPDTPGYALASLNYTMVDQAFREWVLLQAKYLDERRSQYSAKYIRSFGLDDFKRKFLEAPPNTGVAFLFAYTIARLMKLSSLPAHTLQTSFAAQIEANLLFDIALVVDAAIKAKNGIKWKFIDHAEFISSVVRQPLSAQELADISTAYRNDFDSTLASILAGTFALRGGSHLSLFQSDIATAYGLRNRGAHDLSAVPTVSKQFQQIEQALLNVLFATVDHLY